MSMVGLLKDITNELTDSGIEVNKIDLLGNVIQIEGVITIENSEKDDTKVYDYKLTTGNSIERLVWRVDAVEIIIRELKKVKNFKSGSFVSKHGVKYMLIPHNSLLNNFYLLNMETHEVEDVFYTQSELYSEFNLVKEDN
ncbi:hypothetical protein LMHOCYYV_CDS0065 [Staphylococcus phage PG-2021_4]